MTLPQIQALNTHWLAHQGKSHSDARETSKATS